MKTILQTVALLPFLATSAVAQAVTCRTNLASTSVKNVPTTTKTSTNSVLSTSYIPLQPTSTVWIPTISTSSVTVTNTNTITDSTITDTFSTTSTVYNVNTITTPTTTVVTTTNTITTSSTSTTEVATTAGWQPIGDTLNSYNFPGSKKRALGHPHDVVERALTTGTVGLQKALATSSYPAAVTCTKVVPNPNVKTVYTTLHPVTVTKNWPWRTTTSTSTIQTTSTVVPADVSTTITDFYTSQVTTTTSTWVTDTATTSTTTTSVIPGPTVYDACGSNNIFGPNFKNSGNNYYAVNVANNGPGVGSNFNILADGASSATDCCNSCQSIGSCETYIFRQRERNCFLLTHDGESCPNQLNHPNYILSKQGTDTGAGYVVGNGNCGFTYSGNSDASVWPVDSGSGFGEYV